MPSPLSGGVPGTPRHAVTRDYARLYLRSDNGRPNDSQPGTIVHILALLGPEVRGQGHVCSRPESVDAVSWVVLFSHTHCDQRCISPFLHDSVSPARTGPVKPRLYSTVSLKFERLSEPCAEVLYFCFSRGKRTRNRGRTEGVQGWRGREVFSGRTGVGLDRYAIKLHNVNTSG